MLFNMFFGTIHLNLAEFIRAPKRAHNGLIGRGSGKDGLPLSLHKTRNGGLNFHWVGGFEYCVADTVVRFDVGSIISLPQLSSYTFMRPLWRSWPGIHSQRLHFSLCL